MAQRKRDSTVALVSVFPGTSRAGRPSIRTTYQLAAEIPVPSGGMDATFERSVKMALSWMENTHGQALPPAAQKLESFEDDQLTQRVEVISLPAEGLWSARLRHPDREFGGRAAVPGRTWTIEIAFRKRDKAVAFGIRVICASPRGERAEISLTRPRLVIDLAARVGLDEV